VKGEDKDFLELLGYLYLQYGKNDAARIIYQTLCELDNPVPIIRLTYAYCVAAGGSYSVALHEIEKVNVVEFNLQELSGYHLLRGNILWHLRRRREARKELQLFLEAENQRVDASKKSRAIVTSARIVAKAEIVAKDDAEKAVKAQPQEGLWKKFLRFIARKELNRELSR
jgi:tetratricopeptide (TPR) repeat protein